MSEPPAGPPERPGNGMDGDQQRRDGEPGEAWPGWGFGPDGDVLTPMELAWLRMLDSDPDLDPADLDPADPEFADFSAGEFADPASPADRVLTGQPGAAEVFPAGFTHGRLRRAPVAVPGEGSGRAGWPMRCCPVRCSPP